MAELHERTTDLELDRDSLDDELSLLLERRLLEGFRSLAGLNGVFLTPRGKASALELEARRSDVVARFKQLQDDYLRWLYSETEIFGRGPSPDDFLASKPAFLGLPYTATEVERAGARLKEGAFISGESAWQYTGPLRPKVSAKGRLVVEAGRSVHDQASLAHAVQNNFSTTVHGNANVANASPGATQNLVVEGWGERVTETLDAVEQALASLPSEVRDALAPLIAEARIGVSQNEPGRARRALQAVGTFLGDATSGALGGLLGGLVMELIPVLGG